ncbi:cysteine proteinase inhibitor 1-like [Rhododendron vialii]|uniref:cysteine proteinase inhibitor 1-like n=1 Tax=Rhododendron vialii TaxID=182163 RepID=UPI00265D61E2|nr:cysteine proteinase inhibitor 1-like [Rhododendron vialii]
MTIKSESIILILTLLLPLVLSDVSADVGGRKATMVGGWRQIKDLNAPEVQEAAQFAVTEYNKEAGTHLDYQSVVSGETQVVAGTNYRLVIAAKDGTVSGNYEAVVWVKPWARYRNLTSFRKFSG